MIMFVLIERDMAVTSDAKGGKLLFGTNLKVEHGKFYHHKH